MAAQKNYLLRVADRMVEESLGYSGGVLLEGVRACGKTMTGRRHASSEVALDSGLPQLRAALDVDPSLVLAGEAPRLLDEWHVEPSLWNLVRREIDSRGAPGSSSSLARRFPRRTLPVIQARIGCRGSACVR